MEKNVQFEEDCAASLERDDVDILEENFKRYSEQVKLRGNGRGPRFKGQWTKMHDGVQEHFSSHVLINRSSVQLPRNIYALKQVAKQGWMLYKKRECERRKRLREKMEKERAIDRSGGAANILLSMVDTCEMCRKLYITVNLFWGVTLCDMCYFNEGVIEDIMSKRRNYVAENESIHPYKLSESIAQVARRENESFFRIEKQDIFPRQIEKDDESSPEIVVRDDDQIEDDDIRPISTYVSDKKEENSEESVSSIIQEEDEFGNFLDDYFGSQNLSRLSQMSQSGFSQYECSQKHQK